MRHGDFETAHGVSELLRTTPPPDRQRTPRHHQRIWTGHPVDRQRVLVRCYHGLGDTIQFARFLPSLARRTRHLIVWAPAVLLPLLQTLCIHPDDKVEWLPLHDGEPDVAYDVELEIMELLQLLRVTPATIPDRVPYLHVDAHRRAPAAPPRVGIVWSAGMWAPQRSVPAELLVPLLDVPAIVWVSLQHGDHVGSPAPQLPVRTHGDPVRTAMEMKLLDLVISVDSMPAHLAGALGTPVWTLLPFHADWRWMEARDDSPWYPTMRLFRQPDAGNWSAVITRATAALKEWTSSPRG